MKTMSETEPNITIYYIMTLLITLIVFLSFNANFAVSAFEAKPKILFENETYNFGTVEQGTHLEYSFKFVNDGSAPLFIEKIKPSCGCTGAVSDGESDYSEGESGEIKITFNTQGREGHQEKQIHVFTNDPENSDIVLTFSCDISTVKSN